jgi:intein-encoded DNA endonuclease-like protein
MSDSTYLKMLLEERLGENLDNWIRARSRKGLSVRKIAEELSNETGVKVSKSSVHLWM